MNVFIIPSWYPNERNPVEGIFIKEQSEALAEMYPNINFIVSHCENFYLSVSKPKILFNTYKEFSTSKDQLHSEKKNLFEFYKPVLTWTGKLNGEIKNIIRAHTRNYIEAESKFGKIDIIHSHISYPAGFAAMKLNEHFGVPYVITEHMGPFPFDRYLENGRISDKISLPVNNADRVIAVSNFSADQIHSYNFKRPVVIPNMVNENLFYPSDKKPDDKKIKFLTVTSFSQMKGIEELLYGILKSYSKSENNEFIIAGAGNMETYIENFIEQNSLTEKVKLIKSPSRKEIINLFRDCNVFILPSRLESFGIVYPEAMACGKPAIATDCGGPADFMKDFTGLLIKVKDADAVSKAIISVSENISSYSSDKIRQYFLKNYSMQAVCPQIINVYKEVLGYKFLSC